MKKSDIQRMKSEMLDKIRKTPFDELYEQLIESGLETYKDTPNVVRDNKGVEFEVYKGWVVSVNDDDTFDVGLIDMVDTSNRKQANLSKELVVGSPDIRQGSVFVYTVLNEPIEVSSIKFQKNGEPEDAEAFEEIAYRAKQIATKLKKESDNER